MKLYLTLCYKAEVQNLITVKAEECYQACQSKVKVKTTAMSNKLLKLTGIIYQALIYVLKVILDQSQSCLHQ